MAQRNELPTRPNQPVPLTKPILIGAGIGLIVITFFLFGAREPNPEWEKLWIIKPLIMVPLAGALGGALYYFMDHLRYRGGLNRTLAILLSLIGYIITLWLGTVLGLHGTMWD